MRYLKITSLAILVPLTLVGLMASTANAAEGEFIASNTGKLKSKALGTQKFKLGNGATLDCTTAESTGEVTEIPVTVQEISVKYSGCTVFGFVAATVSLADYAFAAQPIGVGIGAVITVHVTSPLCTIVVAAPQTLGEGAGEIEYVNKSGKIEEKNKITKITTEVTESGSESLCGKVGEKSASGTYEGNNEIELEGGTVEYDRSNCKDVAFRTSKYGGFPFNYNKIVSGGSLVEGTPYTEAFELSRLIGPETFEVVGEFTLNRNAEFGKTAPVGRECVDKLQLVTGNSVCEIAVTLTPPKKGQKYTAFVTGKYVEVNGHKECPISERLEGSS